MKSATPTTHFIALFLMLLIKKCITIMIIAPPIITVNGVKVIVFCLLVAILFA